MDLNTALNLIANQHRRKVLVTLSQQNPQDKVPAAKTAHVGEKDLNELRTRMVHIHLPKLIEANVVEMVANDADVFYISRGERFSEIQSLIKALDTFAEDLPGMWP